MFDFRPSGTGIDVLTQPIRPVARYGVDGIRAHRFTPRGIQYYVHHEGCPEWENSWEDGDSLPPYLVAQYESSDHKYKGQPPRMLSPPPAPPTPPSSTEQLRSASASDDEHFITHRHNDSPPSPTASDVVLILEDKSDEREIAKITSQGPPPEFLTCCHGPGHFPKFCPSVPKVLREGKNSTDGGGTRIPTTHHPPRFADVDYVPKLLDSVAALCAQARERLDYGPPISDEEAPRNGKVPPDKGYRVKPPPIKQKGAQSKYHDENEEPTSVLLIDTMPTLPARVPLEVYTTTVEGTYTGTAPVVYSLDLDDLSCTQPGTSFDGLDDYDVPDGFTFSVVMTIGASPFDHPDKLPKQPDRNKPTRTGKRVHFDVFPSEVKTPEPDTPRPGEVTEGVFAAVATPTEPKPRGVRTTRPIPSEVIPTVLHCPANMLYGLERLLLLPSQLRALPHIRTRQSTSARTKTTP